MRSSLTVGCLSEWFHILSWGFSHEVAQEAAVTRRSHDRGLADVDIRRSRPYSVQLS